MDQLWGIFGPLVELSVSAQPISDCSNANKSVERSTAYLNGQVSCTTVSASKGLWFDAIRITIRQDAQLDYSLWSASMVARDLTINKSGYLSERTKLTFTLPFGNNEIPLLEAISVALWNDENASAGEEDWTQHCQLRDLVFDETGIQANESHSVKQPVDPTASPLSPHDTESKCCWLPTYSGYKISIVHKLTVEFLRPWYYGGVLSKEIDITVPRSLSVPMPISLVMSSSHPRILKVYHGKSVCSLNLPSKSISIADGGIRAEISMRADATSIVSIALILVKVEFMGDESAETLVVAHHVAGVEIPALRSTSDGDEKKWLYSREENNALFPGTSKAIFVPLQAESGRLPVDNALLTQLLSIAPSFDTSHFGLLTQRIDDNADPIIAEEATAIAEQESAENRNEDTIALRYSLRMVAMDTTGECKWQAMEIFFVSTTNDGKVGTASEV